MNNAYASDSSEEEEEEDGLDTSDDTDSNEPSEQDAQEEPLQELQREPLGDNGTASVEPDSFPHVDPDMIEPDLIPVEPDPFSDGRTIDSSNTPLVTDDSVGGGLSRDALGDPSSVNFGSLLLVLDRGIDLLNQDTGAPLSNYEEFETVPDKFSEQTRGISGQLVTTLALADRYGREDSNNNLNVFLQVTHTRDRILSMRGIQLGGDSIAVVSSTSGNTMPLPRSAEIQLPPPVQPVSVPQKTRNPFVYDNQFPQTPTPISNLLDRSIDLVNGVTNQHLTNYVLVQTVPDKFSEQTRGISGQLVTTLAFPDRYGREDSNNNLNVFLQVTHTRDNVVSLRGVQLGGDEVQVFINGIDQGSLVKTVEIPMS